MQNWWAIGGGGVTLIYSMASFYTSHEFGSMWCFFSNLFWIVLVLHSPTPKQWQMLSTLGRKECDENGYKSKNPDIQNI
jgi:hypothetical protein